MVTKDSIVQMLSKAILFNGLVSKSRYIVTPDGMNPTFDRDLQFIQRVKPKYIGRAAYFWSHPKDNDVSAYIRDITKGAAVIHSISADIVLEAAVFETCYKSFVDTVEIPPYVFEAFQLPYEKRNFSYESMKHTDGPCASDCYWGTAFSSVPDITRIEAKMWFYYWATTYIQAGYDAIHLGQMMLTGAKDISRDMTKNLSNTKEVYQMVRAYAKEHGCSGYVFLTAHAYLPEYVAYQDAASADGEYNLLYDFYTYPIRLDDTGLEREGDYFPAKITEGYVDSIYGRGTGGKHPAGFSVDENFYILEFDNCNHWEEEPKHNPYGFPWGKDESTWLATLPQGKHGEVIKEISGQIAAVSNGKGFLTLPCHQPIAQCINGRDFVKPYAEDGVCYLGLNYEDTIYEMLNG